GMVTDLWHSPAGALASTATVTGLLSQGQWFGDVDGSTDGRVSGIEGNAITSDVAGAGDLKDLIGIWGRARHRSRADVTTAIGVKGDVFNDASGSNDGDITNAYSFMASCDSDKATGDIITRYGLYIEDIATAAHTTNQYGIYCPALVGATGDNLFIKNISANSDFGSGDILTTGIITTTDGFVIGVNTLDTNEWAFLDGQDQDVSSGSTPTFTATNITGVPAASILAGTFGTGAYVFDNTITGVTDLTIDGSLKHTGDADTHIAFTPD
ncbi:unnamed protein product, partial [marine sediment metagenome]